MTVDELLALTADELEQFYDATRRTYEGGDEEYNTLPTHLRELSIPDGGLLAMIQLAHHRTRELERLRAQVQQDYAAIHTKQQRDEAQISDLNALVHQYHEALMAVIGHADEKAVTDAVDRTIVPPGTIAKMRAENPGPTPEFREAIARARQRRDNTNG